MITKKKIKNMGGNILGVVINKMPIDKLKEYTKDYTKYNNNKIIKIEKLNSLSVTSSKLNNFFIIFHLFLFFE